MNSSDIGVNFSLNRVSAMVRRYWYLLRSSWPRILDLIYWPTVQMLMWGFLQLYVMQNGGLFARASGVFIGAVLLWDILFRGQLGFSIFFLEEMYAHNLGNLMMSPLRPVEFIAALMIMSIVRLSIGMIPVTLLAILFFGFNLWSLGLALTCVYYPVTVLPGFLQYVAWSLPPTYVFEGMRTLLIDHAFRANLMLEAFVFNVVLFAAASLAFLKLLQSARVHGSLLQEGE